MATTFSAEQTTSSAFRFQHSSPLDALVRHSSAKRARAVVQSTASSQQYPSSLIDEYAAPQSVDEREIDLKLSAAYVTVPNGSQPTFQNSIAPVVATGSFKPRNVNMNVEYQNRNDESIYSRVNSFVQVAPQGFRRPGARPEDYSTSPTGTDRATAVPTVKVSSPGVDAGLRAGRMAVVNRTTPNFSRPVRPSSQSEQYTVSTQQSVTLPQKSTSPESNAHADSLPEQRTYSQQQMKFFRGAKSPATSTPASTGNPYVGTPVIHVQQEQPVRSQDDMSPNLCAEQLTTSSQQWQSNSSGSGISDPRYPSKPVSERQPSDLKSTFPPSSLSTNEKIPSIALPRHPPVRSDSPASLYSAYSYYQFENAASSPTSFEPLSRASPTPQRPSNAYLQPSISPIHPQQPQRSPYKNNNLRASSPLAGNPIPAGNKPSPTPQDFLQLGIQNHEANRLRESAVCFEKSAKENGGCGGGMLMWGLTLRHGWGCEKNEKVGFKWLSKAAESAIADLETARNFHGKDTQLVKDELVLAIYEVGQCFFHGWGTSKDQKMAVVGLHFAWIQELVRT